MHASLLRMAAGNKLSALALDLTGEMLQTKHGMLVHGVEVVVGGVGHVDSGLVSECNEALLTLTNEVPCIVRAVGHNGGRNHREMGGTVPYIIR